MQASGADVRDRAAWWCTFQMHTKRRYASHNINVNAPGRFYYRIYGCTLHWWLHTHTHGAGECFHLYSASRQRGGKEWWGRPPATMQFRCCTVHMTAETMYIAQMHAGAYLRRNYNCFGLFPLFPPHSLLLLLLLRPLLALLLRVSTALQ